MVTTAHMVAVFGDVGQVREVAERTDHADGAIVGQALQQAIERPPRRRIALESIFDGELADFLDEVVGRSALLLPDHGAEDAAQEADVVDEGAVLLGGLLLAGRRRHGLFGGTGGVREMPRHFA